MIVHIIFGIGVGIGSLLFALYFGISIWREFNGTDDIVENIGMTVLGCFIAFLGIMLIIMGIEGIT